MASTARPSHMSSAQSPPLNGHAKSTDNLVRTKILITGLRRYDLVSVGLLAGVTFVSRRSGKTSIQQVLFNSLPPKQTFYLETTARIVKSTFELSFVPTSSCSTPQQPELPQHSHSARDMGLSMEHHRRDIGGTSVAVRISNLRYRYTGETDFAPTPLSSPVNRILVRTSTIKRYQNSSNSSLLLTTSTRAYI
jgi:hypothetical protein